MTVRFPLVWQIDAADCGAACLAMVARHFGRSVSLTWLREAVGTETDGTSLSGLVRGAARIGLAAQGVKGSDVDSVPTPAIAHWDGNHWVVVYGGGRRHVRVADPASGLRRIPRDEWERRWTGYCCVLTPTARLTDAPRGRSGARWLWPFVQPHAGALLGAAGFGLAAAGLEMLIPVFGGVIVDRAVLPHDHLALHGLAVAMVALLLAAVAAALAQRRLLARVAVRFDADTLAHMSERLLGLPLRYFETRRTGDLERRLAGMRLIRTMLVQDGVQWLAAGCQLAVAVAIMVGYSPLLAAAFLATAPLYALAMVYARQRLRPLLAALEDGLGRYSSRQIDALKGIETVKALGAEAWLVRLMRRQFDDLALRLLRADRASMSYDAIVQAISFLTLAVVLWAGALLVLDGRLSLGELVTFQGLTLLAVGPVGTLLRGWDALQYASVLLGRIDDVLAQTPEQSPGRLQVPALGGRVQVRGLTIPAILDDVSLAAEPGMTVALVGRSGAGKTTLARCLAGLVMPAAGTVHYDGVDLATLDLRELRRRVGFVLQGSYLFDDTIAANIALDDDRPDPQRLRWAARLAAADGFIDDLPLGYDTRVGESGLALAGGQAQRIAIARAVYRRPAVLILDEPTSSLDAEAERAVGHGLALLKGTTVFVIAHRLSTIRDADRIVVMDRGRIVEQGGHEDLTRAGAFYAHVVHDSTTEEFPRDARTSESHN
jgi:ABC-type bacteriocin/lantibiotic exporter with double-glycine peptidase domain